MRIRRVEAAVRQRKLRVAAYCRVSTKRAEQEDSLEVQRSTYERYILSNPEWEFAGLYADARSGLNAEKREGFMRMIEDAKGGKIDLILCKSISRFSRNIVECQRYTELLRSRNVTVIFEKEHIRTDEPTSSLIFSLMCAIAQDESRSISENMKTAIRHRVEAGVYTPRRNLMLGYDVKDGRFVPNADADVIQHIFTRYAEGAGIAEICRELNENGTKRLKVDKPFSVQNVQRILNNETYVGDKRLQKQGPRNYMTGKPDMTLPYATNYLVDDHAPIISREIWDKVQGRLEREKRERTEGYSRYGKSHELFGRLFCASCGEPYMRCTFTRRNPAPGEDKHYKVWRCRGRLKGSGCMNPVIREDALKGILGSTGKLLVTAEGNVVAG